MAYLKSGRGLRVTAKLSSALDCRFSVEAVSALRRGSLHFVRDDMWKEDTEFLKKLGVWTMHVEEAEFF